ncbi:MAG: signal peptidase I [Ruminococcaceae bacterium]|nr:signal peptidase I [Oscillospiraceae bacterium]
MNEFEFKDQEAEEAAEATSNIGADVSTEQEANEQEANEQEANEQEANEQEANEQEANETVYMPADSAERAFQVSELTIGAGAECDCCEAVKEAPKKSFMASFYDYVETFCYALSLMMLLFLFVFRYVSVDGDSMRDTLHNDDKLIISNLFYTPETGDIVVINPESHGDNQEPIIKRVIATEGQTVLIDYEKWEVYVDGVKLDEPYIESMREIEQQRWGENVAMNGTTVPKYKTEFTVGKGKVFVMGDNRNNSKDSRAREYGEMNVNRILGRVIIRLAPDFGTVD